MMSLSTLVFVVMAAVICKRCCTQCRHRNSSTNDIVVSPNSTVLIRSSSSHRSINIPADLNSSIHVQPFVNRGYCAEDGILSDTSNPVDYHIQPPPYSEKPPAYEEAVSVSLEGRDKEGDTTGSSHRN